MATDFFFVIDTVKGESKVEGFIDAIEVVSWSWGESNAATFTSGTGGGAGKVNMQDLSFVMYMNKASPTLALACASGKHIPKAVLTCRKAGGDAQKYLTITLNSVLVSSYQTGASSGSSELPMDSVTLAFAEIEGEYFQQDDTGTAATAGKFKYNLQTQKK